MCGRIVCVFVALAALANAQRQLSRDDAEKVNRVLTKGIHGDKLECSIRPRSPFLDFAFRFDAGYIANCPVNEFGGKEDKLLAYLRITPDGATPVVLAQGYRLPAIPPDMARQIKLKKLRTSFETSGAFVLGEGRFTVDLLLVDGHNRFYQKQWAVNAKRTGREKGIPLAIAAHTVAAFPVYSWEGKLAENRALNSRVTVLLDATPIDPYAIKLRAWDRAFLLGSLSSLLREIPAESVRLIAFNLDQQRVIFRQDRFDREGFTKLSRALEHLELGTVSYKTLQRKGGWAELLARLVNEESSPEESSDSVIFLGPNTRNLDKVPPTMLLPRTPESPQFFYLEYFPVWRGGSEFPDAIHHATSACKGTVLKIHSPGEFAEAMRKVNERIAMSSVQKRSDQNLQMVHNEIVPKR